MTEAANAAIAGYLRGMTGIRMGIGQKPEGFTYYCAEDYVLDRGEDFESRRLTKHEIEIVANALKRWGHDPQMRECFYNGQMLAIIDSRIRYVEGYAVGRAGIVVHHGWNTINGKVVDLTWRVCDHVHNHDDHCHYCRHRRERYVPKRLKMRNRIWGRWPKGYAYRGVAFETDYIRRRAREESELATLIDDWKNDYPLLREERIGGLPEPITFKESA